MPTGDPQPRRLNGLERALIAIGACCVVLGGLVAAFTGPLELARGSWLAAYLVLICGAAQYALGRIPAWLAAGPLSRGQQWSQLVCWNLGNALVITGTLMRTPVLVDTGAVLLVSGLVIAGGAVRRIDPPTRAAHVGGWAYRVVLLALAISVPVGVLLAHLRNPG